MVAAACRCPSFPLVARRPTVKSSYNCTINVIPFRCRPTSCPRSTCTASGRPRTRGAETPRPANWGAFFTEAAS